MALSFPSNPSNGDTYLSYIWDGVKWGVQAGVGGVAGVSSFNTRVGVVVLALGDVTSATGSGSTAQASLGLATVAASGAYADLSGAPSLASYAPLAAPVFTGDARAVTPAVGDNDTSIATSAFVQAAVAPAANNVGRNRVHNAGFSINQRGYASGAVLAAGVYAHDRWKAGAGGCTYTFTQNQPFTTVTITAGSLQQIIESTNVEGGTYTLSWTGTAQGRVNTGAYAAGPVTVAGLAANTAITVEFNTGTLGRVQLEIGNTATPLEKPDPQQDLAKCQRFYQTGFAGLTANGTAGNGISVISQLAVPMRAVATFNSGTPTMTNCTGAAVAAFGSSGSYSASANATATGLAGFYLSFTASADL